MRPANLLVAAVLLLLAGCDVQSPLTEAAPDQPEMIRSVDPGLRPAVSFSASGDVQSRLAAINRSLLEAGRNIAIHKVEWLVQGAPENAEGQTVYADDRTKTLPYQWVPNDERRNADGTNLTYSIFEPLAVANGSIPAASILASGYAAWNDASRCTDLNIVQREIPDHLFPSNILGFGDRLNDPTLSDIAEIGFVPPALIDLILGPGASSSVLGVTFAFVFVDEEGAPTDIDGDGRIDRAHAEIWYNDGFLWSAGGGAGTDIRTVAQHEQGHALGLGHFGRIFVTNGNGRLHVAPRALMNAAYLGVYHSFAGTDIAAFCQLYASWPG